MGDALFCVRYRMYVRVANMHVHGGGEVYYGNEDLLINELNHCGGINQLLRVLTHPISTHYMTSGLIY